MNVVLQLTFVTLVQSHLHNDSFGHGECSGGGMSCEQKESAADLKIGS